MTTHRSSSFRFALCPLARELSVIFGASAVLAMPAQAAPQGGNVVAGQAAIQQNGALTTITQGSQRAAIDWRSFNVGAAETVNFIQPNANAAILNRVVGNDPSAIFGRITANGQVLLINPNGILFGRTAQVDVGALTATTSNLSNADFMAGRLNFNEPGKAGATVENQGSITVAEGGFAALVGRQVANSGVITARLGKVTLAGGDAFVLDLYGDKLVNLIVDPAAMSSLTDAQGQPLAARVDHSGQILADGGRVQLSVATVKQLVDNLINLSGVVRATSFTNAQGHIALHGDANTQVAVSGTLDTSGERGGRIEVTGRDVDLQSGATLTAAGGQGSIAVGGDWQGKGPLAHADQVNVAQGASLDASGGTEGAGGAVVLWSDKNTQFNGRISAAGGTIRGDAGQVEVSSKGLLGFQGDVDVFAQNGQQGSLLLDPLNLTIAATSSGDSQVSADQLRYFLTRGTNVTLSADQNVTVDAEINGLVTGGGGTAGGGLTLTAGNNLAVNQNIVLNNGALNLTATNGTLSQANNTVLYTGTGAANLRGGAGVNVGQVLSGGAVDIRSANGTVNVRNAIVAATPNGAAAPVASLNVEGAGAVTLNGALVQGNATVRSVNAGVALAGAVLQSQTGNVQVNAGTTITSAANNVGLVAGGTVNATAAQAIDLGAVISTGAATLTSTGGGVTVHQAVTGVGSNRAQGLTVNAAGPVALAGANVGAGGIAITSAGNITSQGASASEGGLLSTGSVTVRSTAGRVGTTGAAIRVQAGSNVELAGSTGITAAAVLGGGTVALSSSAGSVAVTQAIAAEAGAVSRATVTRPTGVTVSGRDGIDLAGAVAGTGGVTLSSSNGAITLQNSVFSQGPVSVTAQGAVTLANGAGIDTTRADSNRNADGSVTLRSQGSIVTIGNAGVRTNGQAASVTVNGAGGVAINGDISTDNDAIAITSGGAVTATASSTSNAAADNATLDAGTDAARSTIGVTATGAVTLGEMVAYNGINIVSGSDVTLVRGLGGSTVDGTLNTPYRTGYVNYADGYQAQYRPTVGRLVIQSGGSVELNGLNLDGNASATATDAGLSVTAARRIVSNREIAVNKGDIVLAGGSTQATDGVYLGSSVYSRGYDVVSGNTRQKTGYGIRVSGRVLGMFDNTDEMALLPVNTFLTSWYTVDSNNNPVPHQVRTDAGGFVVDTAGNRLRNSDGSYQMLGIRFSLGTSLTNLDIHNVNLSGVIVSGSFQGEQVDPVRGVPQATAGVVPQQQIAKIEIANNVANYQDAANARTLVEANTGSAANRRIQIGTQAQAMTIAGVANHTAGTAMRITGPTPQLTAPSQTPITPATPQGTATAATSGIGLKLLSFRESGDLSSQVWSSTARMINQGDSLNFFFHQTNTSGGPVFVTDFPTTAPVEGVFTATVPALATRTYRDSGNQLVTEYAQLSTGNGTVTYSFRIEDGPNGAEVARLFGQPTYTGLNLSSLSNTAPAGSTQVSAWTTANWREAGDVARVRLEPPQLSTAGTASGVQLFGGLYGRDGTVGASLQSGSTVAPNYQVLRTNTSQLVAFQNLQPYNQFSDLRSFQIDGIVADSVSSARPNMGDVVGTRVFAYDGVIETSNGSRTFDGNTGVAIPGLNGIGGFNNSTVGFAGVGAGFGSLGNGTAGSTGVGSTSGQGVGGSQIPGGLTGTGTAPPVTATVEDRSTQDVGSTQPDSATGPSSPGEVAFGVRAAAEADLGRGGAMSGWVVNVFKKRYRVASSSTAACASDGARKPDGDGSVAIECAVK